MYEDIFDKDAPSSLLFKGRERYVPRQTHLKGKHPIRSHCVTRPSLCHYFGTINISKSHLSYQVKTTLYILYINEIFDNMTHYHS